MDLLQLGGLKKISVSTIVELYNDDIIVCPFCNEIIDKNHKIGEFESQEGYKSVECNHCFKISAIKFYDE